MDAEKNGLGDDPHGAMFLVLAYLPLFELLAMGQVCKSLRHVLNNDVWPWLKILIVEKPLNSRLSDDALLRITCKSNGRLTTLALINCVKITDDGLLGAIAKNPLINKLHIPNCTGITPEGVLEAVKKLKHHNGSLRDLQINGIRSINQEHLETLLSLLEINQTVQKEEKCFYPPDYKHLKLRGDQETKECSIDMKICPRCLRGGMVFDCPRLINCNQRRRRRFIFSFNQWRECRGCYGCIRRCEGCGNCVMHGDARGAACGDHIVCNVCWVHSPKCDICNKAYCNQHTDTHCTVPAGSSGFVCHNCLAHSSNVDIINPQALSIQGPEIAIINPQALSIQGPEIASSSHLSPQMEFCS